MDVSRRCSVSIAARPWAVVDVLGCGGKGGATAAVVAVAAGDGGGSCRSSSHRWHCSCSR